MVVFACNACGESLKKNQVENHYLRKCRNCNVLSCLDCGKDFWGNDYEQHTKCISEEEKYSGKNYVAKPSSNKNEVKQLQWIQQVQAAVDKCNANPRLKAILIKLKDQPNIPRKKNKFTNFLASGFHVKDPNLAAQVWNMLMEHTEPIKQQVSKESSASSNNSSEEASQNSEADEKKPAASKQSVTDETEVAENECGINNKKVSKRERKEERRKKGHKSEKKDRKNVPENADCDMENGLKEDIKKSKDKKRKKRKLEEEEEEELGEQEETNSANGEVDTSVCSESAIEEPVRKKFKTKFNWNDVILEVLQAKGSELKIKKLKKKVLAEYLAQGCTEVSEEKLWARFDKKLKKIPEITIVADRVKLKSCKK